MKHLFKSAALAATLLVAPATGHASDASQLCTYVGTYVRLATHARDAGVSYQATVRTYNHGYDKRNGGFYREDSATRALRSVTDAYIHQVFKEPFLSPQDEEARAIGACIRFYAGTGDAAPARSVDDPEPGTDEE